MIRLIRQEIAEWSTAFCFALPGKLGQSIRLIWGRLCLGGMGKASRLARNCRFEAPRNIRIGDANSMGEGCCFFANGGEIRLGQDVRLNTNVHLNASVGDNPNLASCRLLGSRRLEPGTQYSCFLVPAFESGRLTGLGEDSESTPAQLASFGANGAGAK